MRKVKEILRLRFGLGMQQNRSPAVVLSVKRPLPLPAKSCCRRFDWPLPDDFDDRRLEELLFPAAAGRPRHLTRLLPDFGEAQHPGRGSSRGRRQPVLAEGDWGAEAGAETGTAMPLSSLPVFK